MNKKISTTSSIVVKEQSLYSIDITKEMLRDALTTQMNIEKERFTSLHSLLNRLEAKIFTDEFIDSLSSEQKISLYRLVTSNSSKFLSQLTKIQTEIK